MTRYRFTHTSLEVSMVGELRAILRQLTPQPTIQQLVLAGSSRIVSQYARLTCPTMQNAQTFDGYEGVAVLCGVRWDIPTGGRVVLLFTPTSDDARPDYYAEWKIAVIGEVADHIPARLVQGLGRALELEGVPATL